MNVWEVLVPVRANDGKKFKKKFHRAWDARVREVAGGLTIMKPGKGQWISPAGQLYQERMIPVRIVCTEPQIQDVARLVREHYDQEVAAVFMIGQEYFFMGATR